MNDANEKKIKLFFSATAYAVAGASSQRAKFGNKVFRALLQAKKKVFPINPSEKIIEGVPCVASVAQLPSEVKSISIVTPPPVTEQIVDQAIQQGIKNIWMQPGAESEIAIRHCKMSGINVIAGGPCILATLGFSE